MKKQIAYLIIIIIVGLACEKEEDPVMEPSNLKASKGTFVNKIHLTWSAVTDANSYLIYKLDSINDSYLQIATTVTSEYEDSIIFEPMVRFYYKIKAQNANSTSGFSNFDFGYAKEPYQATLEKPVNFTATMGEYVDKIVLNWVGYPTITNYQIYRYDDLQSIDLLIGETSSASFIDTTSILPLKEYIYKIRAYHSEAEFSEFSDIAMGYQDSFLFSDNIQIINGETTNYVEIKWPVAKGANNYEIYRSEEDSLNFIKIAEINDTVYKDYECDLGINYFYKVRANNDLVGPSNFSNTSIGFRLELYQLEFVIQSYVFNWPYSLVYRDNYIYISASGNQEITRMNLDNNQLETFYEINHPRGIEWDSNSNLIIAKSAGEQLHSVSTAGELIKTWDITEGSLREIDIDSEGYIYIVNLSNDNIEKYNSDNELVLSWNSYDDQIFDRPWGIECDGNQVLVSDISGIHFFSKNGDYQHSWWNFKEAYYITAHGDYYYFSLVNQVVKTTREGEIISKIGIGNLSIPAGVTFDDDNNLFVVDYYNSNIQKYSPPQD